MEEGGSGLVVEVFVVADQAGPAGLCWKWSRGAEPWHRNVPGLVPSVLGRVLVPSRRVAPCQQVRWRSCVSLGALGESGTCSG